VTSIQRVKALEKTIYTDNDWGGGRGESPNSRVARDAKQKKRGFQKLIFFMNGERRQKGEGSWVAKEMEQPKDVVY